MGKYYRISQFFDSRYRIYDPLGVHMDLFIGEEKALLFDTGYGFQDLRTEVEQITKLPLLVVNSHGHVDHALGNDQFDCPIYIHPDDIPVCEDHHGRYRKELAINYARTAVDYFTGEPVGATGPDFNEDQYLRKGTGNLVPVTEGHVFDLGGMKLEVVELPGHTPGSIGLLDRDQRILYAADAMNADFWLFMEEACPLSVYRQTLSKASGLEFDTMIISHFPAPLPKKVLFDYMDVADHVCYADGLPFSAPLVPEANARIIIRPGYNAEDAGKEGFASIVISENKIDI